MNGQIKYIVHAFLLLLLLPVLFFSIRFIPQSDFKNNNSVIDYIDVPVQNPPSEIYTIGQSLFRAKCASCHILFTRATGPDLIGFEDRGPWTDRKNLYEWIRNPSAFIHKNKYAKDLQESFNTIMTAFPDITNEEIDAICEYIKLSEEFRHPPGIVKR